MLSKMQVSFSVSAFSIFIIHAHKYVSMNSILINLNKACRQKNNKQKRAKLDNKSVRSVYLVCLTAFLNQKKNRKNTQK